MQALLLICHGSRLKEGSEQAKSFVQQCIESIDTPIKEICFLELAEPSIKEGFETCIKKGATKIAVVPVLLLSANHSKRDIPDELIKLRNQYPAVEITYGRPFGVHESISDLLWEKINNKVSSLKDTSHVLLIGRGSSDPDVKRDLELIAKQLRERYRVPQIQACFLTGSKPRFEDALTKIQEACDQVVIVPYLLFTGLLLKGINKTINEYKGHNEKEIMICEALGYHPILRKVLETRINETLNDKERNAFVPRSLKSYKQISGDSRWR
ncbi:sirohydrochlorin chelatase [Fictibacillus barbaricus]|uniref:Sirohydrochlorin ferrochelatase n=1 Tax=Fictibacillus barbaricus TaxID=182136 RepID=A0ABU1TZ07_9BACL|nr:sirohydrochlorin chelatase [Fictibacillus barbaricus]MDR7072426.1 sirohydrochlorin ferrochelatase [Fictibacillus barbaricus]